MAFDKTEKWEYLAGIGSEKEWIGRSGFSSCLLSIGRNRWIHCESYFLDNFGRNRCRQIVATLRCDSAISKQNNRNTSNQSSPNHVAFMFSV